MAIGTITNMRILNSITVIFFLIICLFRSDQETVYIFIKVLILPIYLLCKTHLLAQGEQKQKENIFNISFISTTSIAILHY